MSRDMNDFLPSFRELDTDGAIEEAAAKAGVTRSQLLRRSAFVGGGLIIGGLPAAFSVAAGSASGDTDILNYALTLEYLEAAFYQKAVDGGALHGKLANFASVVAQHEQAHVDALKKALGSKAVKSPKFDFKGTTEDSKTFGATAKVLEDTGVEAYQGQLTNIKSAAVLSAAASIHPVEAEHAAWIAHIIGDDPAPAAFNPAKTMDEVLAAVKSTGFIVTESGAGSSSGSSSSGTPSVAG
jgi:rubrerythrin